MSDKFEVTTMQELENGAGSSVTWKVWGLDNYDANVLHNLVVKKLTEVADQITEDKAAQGQTPGR